MHTIHIEQSIFMEQRHKSIKGSSERVNRTMFNDKIMNVI